MHLLSSTRMEGEHARDRHRQADEERSDPDDPQAGPVEDAVVRALAAHLDEDVEDVEGRQHDLSLEQAERPRVQVQDRRQRHSRRYHERPAVEDGEWIAHGLPQVGLQPLGDGGGGDRGATGEQAGADGIEEPKQAHLTARELAECRIRPRARQDDAVARRARAALSSLVRQLALDGAGARAEQACVTAA